MNGSKLQKLIVDYINACGWYAVNVTGASSAGTHDVLACVDGVFHSIEVKGEGDTVKVLQTKKQERVIAAGGMSYIAYSLDDVKKYISPRRRETLPQ